VSTFIEQAQQAIGNGQFRKALARLDKAYWASSASPDDFERIRGIAEDVAERLEGREGKKWSDLATRAAAKRERLEASRRAIQESDERRREMERLRLELFLESPDPRQRIYRIPRDRVFAAVLRAVAELSYAITHSDNASGVVSFNTGLSMRSWGGQNVTIALEALDRETTRVVLGGKAAQAGNPFTGGAGQLYTFGELKAIGRNVFARLEAILLQDATTADIEGESAEASDAPEQSSEDGLVQQLERLGALRAQGILTDEEFAAAKAKLIG
jgi:hypothetical protein